ncbi:hypothetical protein NHX12_026400 [Muraenolepis orangiensis]|uniref:Cation efflux protein cytoplasmic domain-containing protein n=1 Tax=Muraenolepis orangiensis TaxID=630683 RepID=A0A9Q0IN80_9TELE|nr:hypothetical protein NHX12_026400 [Muraenolepis orangiensis]
MRKYGFSKDCTELQTNCSQLYDDVDHSSADQLNMRGVFLHVLGDALGSVIVVVNTLIFTYVWQSCGDDKACINPCINGHSTDHRHDNQTLVDNAGANVRMAGPCWVLYLDPTLCVIMVLVLLYTTYLLLKESALILLKTVPKQIDMPRLTEKLLGLDGVLAVHELHIWQLADSRIIATAHIKCQDPTAYMDVAKRIKDFSHDEVIHATTVQPEFETFSLDSRKCPCEHSCRTQCATKLCCGTTDKSTERKAAGDEGPLETSPAPLEVISEDPEQAALVVQPDGQVVGCHRIIATAHIKCHDPTAYMDVAKRIEDFFHDEGIHATTVQPEFVTFSSDSRDSLCELSCRTQCAPKLCCGAADKSTERKAAGDEGPLEASPAPLEVISEDLEQAAALPLVVQPESAITREVESSL